MNLLKRRVKLAQTQEELDVQIDGFLESNQFPLTQEYRHLAGVFIQHLGDTEDSFDPVDLAKRIRAARAKQLAFYVIHPEKRPNVDGSKKVSSATEKVV